MADSTQNLGTGVDAQSRETSLTKAVIKNVDMTEEMQKDTIDVAVAAMQEYPVEKDIAAKVKRDMDQKFTPTWHVVVGKNFGSFVTHETKHFIYFYIDKMAFLIWKS